MSFVISLFLTIRIMLNLIFLMESPSYGSFIQICSSIKIFHHSFLFSLLSNCFLSNVNIILLFRSLSINISIVLNNINHDFSWIHEKIFPYKNNKKKDMFLILNLFIFLIIFQGKLQFFYALLY